ncbi:MAG TPA: UGSC family (seleno)protein, partial [Burkholderiales bacterium]
MIDEFEFFLNKPWSDGLPVVTPTEGRVAVMLAATQRDPNEVIGNIPPAMEPATVRTVAIHALMAGCKPEYLPVVLGALPIMLREEFNMNGVQGTMHGVAPLMIVNGPYAKQIGIHGGNGCFGPSFRANATIGRAIRLMMLNLGGGIPGIASATIFATPLRYTACITENTERSPWETLAVSKRYGEDENVITCAMVESPRLCFDDVSQAPARLLRGIADSMVAMGSWNMHAQSDMVVAMGPQHAAICAQGGMSRTDVHRALCELAGRKVRDLKDGGNWRRERA